MNQAATQNRLKVVVAFNDPHSGWGWTLHRQGRPIARNAGGLETEASAHRAAETFAGLLGFRVAIEVQRREPLAPAKPMHPWTARLKGRAADGAPLLPVYPEPIGETEEDFEARP